MTTNSSGGERNYLLHIPNDYHINVAAPLIFSFHGGAKTASDQEELDGLTNSTFNNNSIVVYPQGLHVRTEYDALLSDSG